MAYLFSGTSSQYIKGNLPVGFNSPCTFSVCFNTGTDNANSTLTQGDANNTAKRRMVYISDSKIVASVVDVGGSSGEAVTTVQATKSSWNNAIGVFSSITSRSAYLNGGNPNTNTALKDAESLTVVGIGGRINAGTWGGFFYGHIAEASIWNVVLTNAEIVSLAKGFSPRRVRPQSLVFYAPLLRNLQDLRAGLALTNNNAATVADHPRVY